MLIKYYIFKYYLQIDIYNLMQLYYISCYEI
jgi:hypothetical protein